jgi:hypothetical protein
MASEAAVILSSLSLLISSSHLIVKHIKSIKSSCVTCYCGNSEEGDNENVDKLLERIDTAISLLEQVKQTPRNKLKDLINQDVSMS